MQKTSLQIEISITNQNLLAHIVNFPPEHICTTIMVNYFKYFSNKSHCPNLFTNSLTSRFTIKINAQITQRYNSTRQHTKQISSFC